MIGTAKLLVTLAAVVGVAGTATVASVGLSTVDDSKAVVTRLVDGDTLDVSIGGRVERIRLLNVDTPETVDPDEDVPCLGPLGVAIVVVGNARLHPQLLAAQREAAAQRRGMYSSDVRCSVPGRVEELTNALRFVFAAAHTDVVRAAFAPAELARIAAGVAQQHAAAQGREADLRSATAAAAVRDTTERPQPEVAPEPAPKPAPAPSGNPYPGYTGPRCYAPGGKTWKPC